MLGVAVVGCGPWGRNHLRNYAKIPDCEVLYACDTDRNCADLAARDFGAKSAAYDIAAVLSDPKVGAVSICTPVSTHFAIARQALLSGKHALVEKPLATSAEECDELGRLAKQQGKKLMAGHVFRFDPTILLAKKLISQGEIGKVHFISLSRLGLKAPRKDVGAIMNYAVHDFDIFCNLLGEDLPSEITASTSSPLGTGHEDVAVITVRFPSGALCHTRVSWLLPQREREFLVAGEKGFLRGDFSQFSVTINHSHMEKFERGFLPSISKEEKVLSAQKTEPLFAELLDFVLCCNEGRDPEAGADIGSRVAQMLSAALLSAHSGRTIYLGARNNS